MSLYLVRHTPVALPKGICYGWLDAPLADDYPRYAQQIISGLSEVKLDKIYSSPSQRCVTLEMCIRDSRRPLLSSLQTSRTLGSARGTPHP